MKPTIGITGCTGSLGKVLLKQEIVKILCFFGDIRKKTSQRLDK